MFALVGGEKSVERAVYHYIYRHAPRVPIQHTDTYIPRPGHIQAGEEGSTLGPSADTQFNTFTALTSRLYF